MTNQDENHIFIESSKRFEDEKSTAYTFLIIGPIGLVLVVLFAAGLLPIPMADYMKVIMTIAMGGMFAIFTVIGIMSLKKTKLLSEQSVEEEKLTKEVREWFLDSFTAEEIDKRLNAPDLLESSDEQLYFLRIEIMRNRLNKQFPALKEDFSEHLLEEFYTELYPQ